MSLTRGRAQCPRSFLTCPYSQTCATLRCPHKRPERVPTHIHHGHGVHTKPDDKESKEFSAGKRVTLYGLFLNGSLAIGKGAAGVFGGSAAMIADAMHSANDMVTDIVTLWSYSMARRPTDRSHPYGFGKYESLGTLTVSICLMLSGLVVATHSIEVLLFAEHTAPTSIALVGAFFGIVSKEALFWITHRVGVKENSDVLKANAWHHRTDAISSVVALIGIFGAMAGVSYLDPIAGLVVAGMMANIGWQYWRSSTQEVTDTAINDEVSTKIIGKIEEEIKRIPDIISHRDVWIRKAGPAYFLEVVIALNPSLSISSSQRVTSALELLIQNVFDEEATELTKANILLESLPVCDSMPLPSVVERDITTALGTVPSIVILSPTQIHYNEEGAHLVVQVLTKQTAESGEQQTKLRQFLETEIVNQLDYVTTATVHLKSQDEELATNQANQAKE